MKLMEKEARIENCEFAERDAAAVLVAYKTVLDGILDLVSPDPSNENVSVAVRRVVSERNQWREVADRLFNCAIGDTTCDEWNKAYAEYEAANAGARSGQELNPVGGEQNSEGCPRCHGTGRLLVGGPCPGCRFDMADEDLER